MRDRLVRAAGAVRSAATFEPLERRVMMDASYVYNGQESVLKLPTDRLGAVGVSGSITVLDDLNGDGTKEFAASGAIQVLKPRLGPFTYLTVSVVQVFDGKSGSVLYSLGNPGTYYSGNYWSYDNQFALGDDLDSDGLRDLIVLDFFDGSADSISTYSAKTGTPISHLSLAGSPFALTTANFAGVGDINGDGEPDIVVSGIFPTQVGGQNVLLRAYSALSDTLIWESAPESGNRYRGLKSKIIPVGDLNGDGKTDILVGGDNISPTPDALGAVYLVSGANGSLIRAWQVGTSSNVAGNRLAYLGDVNADGVGDFAVVSYERTTDSTKPTARISVYSLDNSSLITPIWVKENIPWTNETVFDQIGFKAIDDFNHDGVRDLAVMVDPSSPQSTVQIRSGRNGALIQEIAGTSVVSDRGRTTGNIFFGSSIASGDLDGDGFSELLVGVQQAESPGEGKTSTNPFVAVIPFLQFETPIVTRVNAAGVAFGTVAGEDFVTVDGVVTLVKALKGVLATDFLIDRNKLEFAIGASKVDGPAFILDRGARIDLSTLATVDRLSTNPGFVSKPSGTYTMPIAIWLASHARAGLVKVMRDGTVSTTWLLRRNSTDSAYELVYLFDGEPGAISADGHDYAVDGSGSALSYFISERTSGGVANVPSLFPVEGGIEIKAITAAGFVGVRRTDSQAVVGFFNFPLDRVDLTIADLPRFDGVNITPLSVDRQLNILASVTKEDVTHSIFITHDITNARTVIDLAAQPWLRGPDFHDTSESITPLALSPSGRVYALHDSAAFSLASRSLLGPFEVDPAGSLAGSPVGLSGTAIVGLNDFGELLYYRRESETSPWSAEELPVPTGAAVYGAVVWGDGVAIATSVGVIRLARAVDGSWDSRNLTTTIIGADAIVRSVRLVNEVNGYLLITGFTSDNRVVFYGSEAANPDKDTTWGYYNLSESVLDVFGIADPGFQGDLVTYVTPWNGLNIAGLNADGEPVAFWTAPELTGWRFTNLALSQEDPTLARGFERLTVNVLPWGGIGLTNADSSLRTVWWSPGLGGVWKFAALADAVSDSARPTLVKESIVGYATTWGGQNIAGVDAQGHLWVFWWSPASDKWVAQSLQSNVSALKDRKFTTRLAAYTSSGAIPMAVTAVDTAQHAVTLYFKVGEGWRFTDATEEMERA